MAKRKTCKVCKKQLTVNLKNFQTHYSTEDGFRHVCRKCQKSGGKKGPRTATKTPKREAVLNAIAVANTENGPVYYLMEAAKKLTSQTDPISMSLSLPAGELSFSYKPRGEK